MELTKLGEKTYCIQNPTNIGIYKLDDNKICLIDTGNDKESGRKILKIINEQNWQVECIINTHSNADHVGGNKFIQDRTNCKILSSKKETAIINNPELEPALLYGAMPLNELNNKFLLAKESDCQVIDNNLPEGLEYFTLKGHFIDMIGIKTSDNIYFLGDSIFSEETINKYHIFFIYDVEKYLQTLDFLETLNGTFYIPSHVKPLTDLKELIKLNKNKINEICNAILNACQNPITTEEIIKKIFDTYNLEININQYALLGSTIKSYLTYLNNQNRVEYFFKDNLLYWLIKNN
ncbi:MAG: MBL fold metallo-hydrolase [Tenericutes bacterium]|nr:MBL fold metallo-hydrolase [Mycoplasmatota bacterium]